MEGNRNTIKNNLILKNKGGNSVDNNIKKNYKSVQLVLFAILIANILVAILKLTVGILIKSASLTADGFHSFSDGSSNIVGMIGVHFAAKPADKGHKYGHDKIETLSSMLIGLMLLVIAVKIFMDAFGKLSNPVAPTVSIISLAALVLTLIVNITVTAYESKKGRELNSMILISDAKHTKSDIFVSFSVLLGLVGMRLGLPAIIDPILSMAVGVIILKAAWDILKENGNILIDGSVIDEDEIKEATLKIDKVMAVHKVKTRGTKNKPYVEMHILVNPLMTTKESHELEHSIENMIRYRFNSNAEVGIHVEPYSKTMDIEHDFKG